MLNGRLWIASILKRNAVAAPSFAAALALLRHESCEISSCRLQRGMLRWITAGGSGLFVSAWLPYFCWHFQPLSMLTMRNSRLNRRHFRATSRKRNVIWMEERFPRISLLVLPGKKAVSTLSLLPSSIPTIHWHLNEDEHFVMPSFTSRSGRPSMEI